MWQKLVVLCAVVGVAFSATAISRLEEKPEEFKDTPGCYIKALGKVIAAGAEETGPGCVKYLCGDDLYHIHTCSPISYDAPCKLVTDPSKPYPDCCPKLEC